MKKITALLLAVIMVLAFAGCKKADTTKWDEAVSETFKDVVVYKYGTVDSAVFGNAMNVKIIDTDYDDFVKYIGELKEAGFTFLPSAANVPENYSLYEGQATWRCSNGSVFLQLIFSEDGSNSFDNFKCNVQIYGYDNASYLVPQTTEADSKKSDKKDKKEAKSEKASSKKAQAATEAATKAD